MRAGSAKKKGFPFANSVRDRSSAAIYGLRPSDAPAGVATLKRFSILILAREAKILIF